MAELSGVSVFGLPVETWTAVSSAATLLVAILTFGTLWFNRRVVNEMKEDRLAQVRPHVLLNFAIQDRNITLILFHGASDMVMMAADHQG